jgi:hypothetical protein
MTDVPHRRPPPGTPSLEVIAVPTLPGPEEWRDLPEHRPHREQPVPRPADRTLPGDTTVPNWVMVSTVLGLVALTGSIAAICLVGLVAVLVWLAKAPPCDKNHAGLRHLRQRGPWG